MAWININFYMMNQQDGIAQSYEWDLMEKLIHILKYIRLGTNLIEGEKYVTICKSNEPLHVPVLQVKKELLKQLLERFNFLWDNSDILVTSFFDPKTKKMQVYSERLRNKILGFAKDIIDKTLQKENPEPIIEEFNNDDINNLQLILGLSNY